MALGVRATLALERLRKVGEHHRYDRRIAEYVEPVAEHSRTTGRFDFELDAGPAASAGKTGRQGADDGAHGLVAAGQDLATASERQIGRHSEDVLGGLVVDRDKAVVVDGDDPGAHLLENDVGQRHSSPRGRG